MSQDIFTTIDPSISGTDLATVLNSFKAAIVSGMSGTSRPAELQPGGMWVDTSNDPTTWTLKLWTGIDDVDTVEIDLSTGAASVSLAVDSFIVRKVSDDTVGAVMELVKRRIASNGQVLNGDVVGEVRMVGRDNASGNPIVAKIIWTAAESQTSSAFGGTLSFYSTPAGQNSLVEHMRFIGGVVETLVPLKMNSQILGSQNIATAATISQLSADKSIVELTGSTATSIQGLNSAHASKVVAIHNRSSAIVTLKNQDTGAIAADRILIAESKDIAMQPQDSVTLYYCSADSRWKVLYASSRFTGFQNDILRNDIDSWTAPASVSKIRVVARSKKSVFSKTNAAPIVQVLDQGGNLWSWGQNQNGSLGVGSVASQSSPAVSLRNLKFVEVIASGGGIYDGISAGLSPQGVAYAWGANDSGQLGVGDVASRSSPVAVLGGFTFKSIYPASKSMAALTTNGLAYMWGSNGQGELGVGDIVPRSSPVAVLGGITFKKLFALPSNQSGSPASVFGLTLAGSLYSWGGNQHGQLGLGDTTSRSSPVAVLGGLIFREIIVRQGSTWGITEDNDLYAWGINSSGQLGVGDRAARSSPVAVLGGLKFRSISTNTEGPFGNFVSGITTDGTPYSWGTNSSGELGVGDVADRSSPVAVLGGLVLKKSIAVGNTSYAMTENGAVYAWGYEGSAGELGQGSAFTPVSSPVVILAGTSFQDISSIQSSSVTGIGITWDGKLYSWGDNFSGERGVGDTSQHLSPTLVSGNLSMKTQDDSDTVLDIPVIGGSSYSLRLGAGPCFFGSNPIGSDIYEAEVTYVV